MAGRHQRLHGGGAGTGAVAAAGLLPLQGRLLATAVCHQRFVLDTASKCHGVAAACLSTCGSLLATVPPDCVLSQFSVQLMYWLMITGYTPLTSATHSST